MADKKIVFVSYYTDNYAPYAANLIASLRKFRLDHDVINIKPPGPYSWHANVRYKPVFLREMLQKHKDAHAIVWIDADGVVVNKPNLFWHIDADLGVHFLKWPQKEELLSGTVYLAQTRNARTMMDKWIEALRNKRVLTLSKPEQQVLQKLLPRLRVRVFRLPGSYCYIAGWKTAYPGKKVRDSVIEHRQASRLYRNSIDGNPRPRNKPRFQARKRRRLRHKKGQPEPGERPRRRKRQPVDAGERFKPPKRPRARKTVSQKRRKQRKRRGR